MSNYCLECGTHIDYEVFNYSTRNLGFPLCIEHQNWILFKSKETTPETIELYFALKFRKVPAKLELFDGYKTIDIAIPAARVNIEIDGGHHNYSHHQALSDLQRTYYSFLKGYLTLRVPNSLVRWDIEQTADYITRFLVINRDRHFVK